MDVLWFVVLFLVVQFFHAFSNYGPSICIPPPKYHINSSANWHSLQAVRAGCLLFRRVLLSVRTPLSILTFWPAPKLITDASQSKDSVSRCYSQTFKALQFSMFCNINIVNMSMWSDLTFFVLRFFWWSLWFSFLQISIYDAMRNK